MNACMTRVLVLLVIVIMVIASVCIMKSSKGVRILEILGNNLLSSMLTILFTSQ